MLPMYGANYTHRPPERPQTTGQPNNAPRQLEFNEAMSDFKHMFPTVDRDVIEAVLRANNGLVDATIDQLLSMGVDVEGSIPASNDSEHPPLPSYSVLNEPEPPPAYSPRENNAPTLSSAPRPLPARPYSAWNPPLLGKLPDDFLRLGPSKSAARSPLAARFGDGMDDKELEQFLEDEKLAMVLQNEEFMRELRHNKDFMLSLEKDRQRNSAVTAKNLLVQAESTTSEGPTVTAGGTSVSGHTAPSSTAPVSVEPAAGAVGGHQISPASTHDDAVLRERLRHMGKSTRKKFDKLAKMFHRKNVNRANIIAAGSAASTANLLDGYNEDDDDEMLNVIGSARLEIMDERDEDNEREKAPQQSPTHPQPKPSEPEPKKPGSIEPIVFFSEDNEFEYKNEN